MSALENLRVNRLLPLLVLAVTLSITWLVWQQEKRLAARDLHANFDFRVRETVGHIDQRMLAYAQTLRSVGALFDSSRDVKRSELQVFVDKLHIGKYYPGIQGIGFSLIVQKTEKGRHTAAIRKQGFPQYKIWPDGERDLYTSITQLEPFSGRNLRAFGYDMYSEPVRRAAMEQARDSGDVAISSKVKLVQEMDEQVQAGFLMYLPVYKHGEPHATLAQRRANIIGWVYAPFRMNDLMFALNGERSGELDVELYDGEEVSDQALMYDSNEVHAGVDLATPYQAIRRIEIAGHPWNLIVRPTSAYEARVENDTSAVIAVAGIALSLLLSLLTWQLVSGRGRALALAAKMNRELIESEARFRNMADSAPVLIWMAGTDGFCTWFNKGWLDFTGRTMEQETGNGWSEGIHPVDLPRCLECFASHFDRRTAFSIEYRRKHNDGEYRWLVDSAVPRMDDSGNFAGFIGSSKDITERKQAEEGVHRLNRALMLLSACNAALIHAQEEKQLLLEICRLIVETGGYRMAWVGFAEDDEEKTVRPVTQFGFEADYLDSVKITWSDTVHGQGVTGMAIRTGKMGINRNFLSSQMAAWRESALKHGYQSSIALPLKDGEKAFGALSIYSAEPDAFNDDEVRLLEEMANDLAFGVVLLRMLAERKRTDEALRESELKFRTLAENSPSLILRYDRECRRTFINAAYERETGVPLSEILHLPPDRYWRASMPLAEYKERLRRVMESGQPDQLFFEWTRADTGAVASYAAHLVPEYGVDGEVMGVLAIGHNITALKEVERRLEESHAQLRELTLRREEAREEERKSIARDIHDELGQLLTALRMSVSLMKMQFGENRPRLAEQIENLKARVDAIISVVRNVASRLRPAVLDMGIVSALEWLREEFIRQNGSIRCELTIGEEAEDLEGERATTIFRIVQESLTNIARYAQASKVNIALERKGEAYLLEVRDDGVGFDPGATKNKSFGLIGIRERVLMMGGEMSIASAPGSGTALKISIPV